MELDVEHKHHVHFVCKAALKWLQILYRFKCIDCMLPKWFYDISSEMFTGCIWDKQICEQSIIYVLGTLKLQGYIQDSDCIVADKGFTIREEWSKLKNLNHKPINMALKYVKIKVNISLEYLGFKYELWPRDNGNNKSSKNKHTGRAVYILEPAMVSQFCYF